MHVNEKEEEEERREVHVREKIRGNDGEREESRGGRGGEGK